MDELVVRIEGPGNEPGTHAADKLLYAFLRAFDDRYEGLHLSPPEWIEDGHVAFTVTVETPFIPEDVK